MMRLLIVEDEPGIALAIEDVALAAGFEISGMATNLPEALELGPEADIAIIDVRLGDGLTGPSIARALFARFGLGVVYLTANPDLIEDRGEDPVLAKPVSPEKVMEALSMAARSVRERRLQDQSDLPR